MFRTSLSRVRPLVISIAILTPQLAMSFSAVATSPNNPNWTAAVASGHDTQDAANAKAIEACRARYGERGFPGRDRCTVVYWQAIPGSGAVVCERMLMGCFVALAATESAARAEAMKLCEAKKRRKDDTCDVLEGGSWRDERIPANPNLNFTSPPQMRANIETYAIGDLKITFTSTDERPIVIERVVINKRAGTRACDIQQDPATSGLATSPLAFGDFLSVASNQDFCGKPVRIDINTNLGPAFFVFN